MSVQRVTIDPQSRTAAVDPQALGGPSLPSAATAETVCVASVCAIAETLEKCGASCASVMTSTACATKGSCAQAMVSVTVVPASVHRTGRVRTVTAPDVLTPVCHTWACCAVGGVSVCVGPVSAPSLVPTGPRVTSAPPALVPVP